MAIDVSGFSGGMFRPTPSDVSVHTPRTVNVINHSEPDQENNYEEKVIPVSNLITASTEPLTKKPWSVKADTHSHPVESIGATLRFDFLNTGNVEIFAVFASGVRMPIPPTSRPGTSAGSFHLIKDFSLGTKVSTMKTIHAMSEYLKSINGEPSDEAKAYLESLRNAEQRSGIDKYTARVESIVDIRAIETTPIYIPELDILLTTSRSAVHPKDPYAEYSRDFLNASNKGKLTSTVISIVDNDDVIGPRFIYSAGEAQRVDPVKIPGKANGVYIGRVDGKEDPNHALAEFKHYTLSEAEDTYVFKTKEGALTGGNPKALLDIRKVEIEKEHLDSKSYSNMVKMEVEMQQLELKQRLVEMEEKLKGAEMNNKELEARYKNSQLKEDVKVAKALKKLKKKEAELKEREMQLKEKSMIRADRYEDQSYRRKNTSELLKYGIPVAAGIVGMLVGTGKLKL